MGNFKALRVWQDSLTLAIRIYEISRQKPFSTDYGLCNQIQRAVVSISSNIAEGDERGTSRQAIYFFHIAKGSAAEVITQLHIAKGIGYIDNPTLKTLENETEKISASLKNLIKARKKATPNHKP